MWPGCLTWEVHCCKSPNSRETTQVVPVKVKVFFNRAFNLLCSAFKRLYLYFECKCRINNGFQEARDVVSSILVQPYVAFLGSYVWWCGSSSAAWWSLMIPVCLLKSESHKACLHLETSFRLRKMPNWNVLKAVQVGFSQGFSSKNVYAGMFDGPRLLWKNFFILA